MQNEPASGRRAHYRRSWRGAAQFQSEGSTSPPAGVQAAHQVAGLMLRVRKRTLPSARAVFIPPVWEELATRRSHGPGLAVGCAGCTRNIEAVSVRNTVPSIP